MIREDARINRTGVAAAPKDAQALSEDVRAASISPAVGVTPGFDALRVHYADISGDVGTVPPPLSGQGAEKVARQGGAVLLDRMGERLVFERVAVRLYEALIVKHEAYGSWDDGPTLEDLRAMRGEELSHFLLLRDLLTDLGADPSAVSPSADVRVVLMRGLLTVLTDPRTTLLHGLEAMLMLEQADSEGWEMVEDVALAVGDDALVPDLVAALEVERAHVHKVRAWIAAGVSGLATGGMAASFQDRAERRRRAAEVVTRGSLHVHIEQSAALAALEAAEAIALAGSPGRAPAPGAEGVASAMPPRRHRVARKVRESASKRRTRERVGARPRRGSSTSKESAAKAKATPGKRTGTASTAAPRRKATKPR